MRDLNRIPKILHILHLIWNANPDLRLCQLIGNCFLPGDNYYREDDELEKALLKVYQIYEEKTYEEKSKQSKRTKKVKK